MIDTLLTDTLIVTQNSLLKFNATKTHTHNYWLWISIIEFLIIVYFIFFRNNPKSKVEQFINVTKEDEIDFGNIINSSFNVKPLYDELKVKCHPDRFPNDTEKNKIAMELSQEISKNKTNYKKLMELKELAKEKLNINF